MQPETLGNSSDIKNQMTVDEIHIHVESKVRRGKKGMAAIKARRGLERLNFGSVLDSTVKELNMYTSAIAS